MTIGTPTALGSASSTASGSSFSITTTAAIAAGDLVIVATQLYSSTSVTSVNDGTNAYFPAFDLSVPGATEGGVWYCISSGVVASGSSIVVGYASNAFGGQATAAKVSGVASFDATNSVSGGGTGSTNYTITTGTLTSNSAIVFGLGMSNGGTFSSSNFTLLTNYRPLSIGTAITYNIVSSTSPVAFNPSFASTNNVAAAAIFYAIPPPYTPYNPWAQAAPILAT